MEDNFVTRLSHIPLVSSAIGQVGSLYSLGKERHLLFRLACRAAELSFKVAAASAQPVIGRLEQPSELSRLK